MTDTLAMVPLELLLPSPTNPRKHFDREGLEELAKSIEQFGILAPLIVRPWPDQSDEFQGCMEIVAGERRFRGSTIAKQTEIPCIIRELNDDEVLQIQIIENLQRADIHPLEEADGFKKLIDRGVETVTTIAHKVGKSEEYVHGRIKLSALQGLSRLALEEGILPIGHALLIAKLDEADQDAAAGAVGIRLDHEGKIRTYYQSIEPMRVLRRWIEQSLVLDMAGAAFDLEDATLNPDRGACSLCPLRTINNGILFPEMAGSDRCTDRRCFEVKLSAHMERKRAELEAQGPVIMISESYSRSSTQGAIPSSQYTCVPATRQAELHAIEDRDEDLFAWLVDFQREGFDQLAPKTFTLLSEACHRSIDRDCDEEEAEADHEELAASLALDPPAIDFNDVRYTKADDGVEWPSIDEEIKVAEAVASQPGVVMALMVDGPNKGAVLPVRLNQQAAAKVGDEDAAEQGRAERAKQREDARLRRAEMISRRRIFDCVLALLTAEAARAHFPELLTAISIKAAMMNANSVGDTADPQTGRHPGRGQALTMLGHKGSRWDIKASKLKVPSELDAWKAAFVAFTYDEIHVGQTSGDQAEPIALMAFAKIAGVDVDHIRKEEDWNTLSKKQQAERTAVAAKKAAPRGGTDKVDQALAATMEKIDDDVLDVLARSRVEGTIVFLPEGQLDRKLYERVNKVLQSLGGSWNRTKKGHIFAEDPEEALLSAIDNGAVVDRKKALQFFATPAVIADQLVALAEIDSEGLAVLEPSAGAGAIVSAVIRTGHELEQIAAVDFDEEHGPTLEALGVDVYHEDFLITSAAYLGHEEGFDRVVMNPPFSKQQDIDHVWYAFNMLRPAGILVSVMSPSWLFRENKKSQTFREFVNENGGEVIDLPEGSFMESGTAVRAVILKLQAPSEVEAK